MKFMKEKYRGFVWPYWWVIVTRRVIEGFYCKSIFEFNLNKIPISSTYIVSSLTLRTPVGYLLTND